MSTCKGKIRYNLERLKTALGQVLSLILSDQCFFLLYDCTGIETGDGIKVREETKSCFSSVKELSDQFTNRVCARDWL